MNEPFPRLIGFAGKARSGKDTAGEYLVDNYNFLRYSFAQPLKDATKIMFGLTDEQINDKEKAAEPWGMSPRDLYQRVGTDIARNIDVNVWVKGADMFVKKILSVQLLLLMYVFLMSHSGLEVKVGLLYFFIVIQEVSLRVVVI